MNRLSKMKRLCAFFLVGSLLAFAGSEARALQAPPASQDRKEVLHKARMAYYSLRGLGLLEFQSSITPTWEVTLAQEIRNDPASAQAGIKTLNGLHFAMTLDEQGKVKVAHRSDAPPPNEKAAAAFNQIYSGMDQAVSGFFETWSMFMLTSPFPETNSDYQVEDLGTEYRLSYKDGSADVVTIMNKDLMITELQVTSPEFFSSIRPQLSRRGGGFILDGYDADYRPTSGQGVVKLNVKLDYQDVNGLQLPRRLNMDSVYDGNPNQMELVFSDYQVKTH
jgi:hypothetical protein